MLHNFSFEKQHNRFCKNGQFFIKRNLTFWLGDQNFPPKCIKTTYFLFDRNIRWNKIIFFDIFRINNIYIYYSLNTHQIRKYRKIFSYPKFKNIFFSIACKWWEWMNRTRKYVFGNILDWTIDVMRSINSHTTRFLFSS